MKIAAPKQPQPSSAASIVPGPLPGTVKLTHTQSIKQSINYQTGDVGYAVELVVRDNPKAIAEGLARAEKIVEDALGDKLPQTTELLRNYGKANK